MAFIDDIKIEIGDIVFSKLEKEAENEVALALKMPLIDQYNKEKYYTWRLLMPLLLSECLLFEQKKLKISPLDVVSILFKVKLLFACQTEKEYQQRVGGRYFDDKIRWSERVDDIEKVIERHFENLTGEILERILVTHIEEEFSSVGDISLAGTPAPRSIQVFFEDLFKTLDFPFEPYFEGEMLVEKCKELDPYYQTGSSIDSVKKFFSAPSIGHKIIGSYFYCYWYSSAWLRTFFNMLRVAGFIYPGQTNFGDNRVRFIAPTSSVFLGTRSFGCYCWEEDKKEPWQKTPDGCMFLSFGYRGLSNMWLDIRNFGGIEKFFTENSIILKNLSNPWMSCNLNDIAPILDILSSATQIPDLGAKILQIYCCLEHMFVPKNVGSDNKKYIVGGINALKPDLINWFNDLYKLRCEYAHRGFVIRDEKIRELITNSIGNIMILLVAKLSINANLNK